MASFNTVAGCFLASALFAMVVGKVSNVLVSPEELAKPVIAVPAEAAEPSSAPSPEATLPPIGPKLASANVKHGAELFKRDCSTCHTDDKGGANKVGPNQWNLVGRKKGAEPGFSYSSAMEKKGGTWTYEDLNHMIFKPQAFVKGTKMAFAGMPKEQDRADIIAYLRTMNDNPPPLPDANAKPAEAKPAGDQPAGSKPAEAAPEKK
jgi:cytochrome c